MNDLAKLRAALSVAALLGVVTQTGAQPIESLTFSVVWDKAVIAPGETNTGKVIATVGPTLGTLTQWNSPPGKGQAGVLMAFASSIFDLKSTLNGWKGICYVTIPAEFNISSLPLWSDGQGGWLGINAGQIGPPINPWPVMDQSVTVLKIAWKAPAITDGFDVMYSTKVTAGKVFLDIGTTSPKWVGENAVKIDGQGGFTVLPAPGAGFAFIGAVVALQSARRRR